MTFNSFREYDPALKDFTDAEIAEVARRSDPGLSNMNDAEIAYIANQIGAKSILGKKQSHDNTAGINNPGELGSLGNIAYGNLVSATGAATKYIASSVQDLGKGFGIDADVARVIGKPAPKEDNSYNNSFADSIVDYGNDVRNNVSPEYKAAMQKNFFAKDNSLESDNSAWTDPRAIIGTVASGVAQFIPSAIATLVTKNPAAGAVIAASMEAGGAKQQVYDTVTGLDEKTISTSPLYKDLVDKGMSKIEAQKKVAYDLATAAGNETAIVSGALEYIGGKYLLDGVLGDITGSVAKKLGVQVAAQGGTEGFQGLTQQGIQNINVEQADNSVNVTDNLANSAAQESLGGIGVAGVVGGYDAYKNRNKSTNTENPGSNIDELLKEKGQADLMAQSGGNTASTIGDLPEQDNSLQGVNKGLNKLPEGANGFDPLIQVPKKQPRQNSLREQLNADLKQTQIDQGINQGKTLAEHEQAVKAGQEADKAYDLLNTQKANQVQNSLVQNDLETQINISMVNDENALPNNVFSGLNQVLQQPQQAVEPSLDEQLAELTAKPLPQEVQPVEPQQPIEQPIAEPQAITIPGKKGVITSEKAGDIEYQYELVEAKDLAPQTDTASNQARDRNRIDAQAQVNQIANNIKPNLLLESPTMRDGAPVITPSGHIIAGNGRTMAIQQAYGSEKADAYRAEIAQKAQKFGFDKSQVEAMSNPVIVRRINREDETGELAILSNEEGSAAMSPLEQAAVDAKRIGTVADFNINDKGEISDADFNTAAKRLVKLTGMSKRGDLMTASGQLSESGKNRVRNAILFKAYGNSPILGQAIESQDDGFRNITKALVTQAPQVAAIKDGIEQGEYFDAGIDGLIVKTIDYYSDAKSRNLNLAEYIAQDDMFGTMTNEEKTLLNVISENIMKPKAISDFIGRYNEALIARGAPNQNDMFGSNEPTRQELLDHARQSATSDRGRSQGNATQSERVNNDGERNATGESQDTDGNARESQPADNGQILTTYTQEDLNARDEAKTKAQQDEVNAIEKDKQQATADDFNLTGSDTNLDQAAAQGQTDMLGELADAEQSSQDKQEKPVRKSDQTRNPKGNGQSNGMRDTLNNSEIPNNQNAQTQESVQKESPKKPGGLKLTKAGKPFKNEKVARASKTFKSLDNGEVVPVDGGFGVREVQTLSTPKTAETTVKNEVEQDASADINNKDSSQEVQGSESGQETPDKKIEDFGEKLEGAKKFKQTLSKTLDEDLDVRSLPLSKSFPKPDTQKMIDNGVNKKVIAFVLTLRNQIKAKPRKGYKLDRWVKQVELARDLSSNLLQVEPANIDKVLNSYADDINVGKFIRAVNVADKLNTANEIESLADSEIGRINGQVSKENISDLEVAENSNRYKDGEFKSVSKGDYPTLTGDFYKVGRKYFAELDNAQNYLIASLIGTEKKAAKTKFISWSMRNKPGEHFVGKQVGKNYITLASGFKSSAEARNYIKQNQEQLEKDLIAKKDVPPERIQVAGERIGEDYRNGKDITPEEFTQAFGFRGVQFGNWVENKKRQNDLNEAYDGLMDLAGVLDIPPRAISLDGQLGLAFGARGSKGAKAHYEPGKVVINLTKNDGAGSLAHEWLHALDNYFGKMDASLTDNTVESPFATEQRRPKWKGVTQDGKYVRKDLTGDDFNMRESVYNAWVNLADTIKDTELYTRSLELDGLRSKPYWATDKEMAARSFDDYIISKLQEKGYSSDYLASPQKLDGWAVLTDKPYPFPVGEEATLIRKAFDNLFNTIETKETDNGNIALFSRKDNDIDTSNKVEIDKNEPAEITDLRNDLGRYYGVEASEVQARADELPIPDDVKNALEAIFGKRIIGFKGGKNASAFNGLILPGKNDRVYVASDSTKPVMNIAGHELLHSIREENPELYSNLVSVMMPLIRNEWVYLDKLNAARKKEGKPDADLDMVIEEILADVMGDNFTQKAFWAKVSQSLDAKKPGLFDKLMKIVKSFLSTLKSALNPLGHDNYVSDVEAAQTAVAEYAALHIKSRMGSKKAKAQVDKLADNYSDVKLSRKLEQDNGKGSPAWESAKAKGLDMSQEARMQRAKEMGFDTDTVYYHGTGADFDAFNLDKSGSHSDTGMLGTGFYFSSKARVANDYARRGKNGNVIQAFLKTNNPFIVNNINEDLPYIDTPSETIDDLLNSARSYSDMLRNWAIDNGYDSIIRNMAGGKKEVVVFEPNQIRSINAAFDTDMADSPNLMFSRKDSKPTQDNGTLESFRSKFGREDTKTTVKNWAKEFFSNLQLRLAQGIFDKYRPLLVMDKSLYGDDVIKNNTTHSSWVLAKMSEAGQSALSVMMQYGRIKYDAKQKVLQPTEDSKNKGFLIDMAEMLGSSEEIDRFFRWVAANRSSELMKQDKEHLFTSKEIEFGLRENEGKLESGKSRKEAYLKAHQKFKMYHNDVLDIATQAGIVSKESRADWENQFYVPFYRVMDDDTVQNPGVSGGSLKPKEAYKKLKGGTQNVNDLLENTLMNWNHLLTNSMRNMASQQAIANAEEAGIATKMKYNEKSKRKTHVFVDGKKVEYDISDQLVFDALTMITHSGIKGTSMDLARGFKRVFTNFTTASPQFIAANLIRDSLQAVAVTDGSSYNVYKNIKGGGQKFGFGLGKRMTKERAQIMAAGGSFSFGYVYGRNADDVKYSIDKQMGKIIHTPSDAKGVFTALGRLTKTGWDKWQSINDMTENVNRMSIYDTINTNSDNKLYAALQARDLMDFSAHGSYQAIRFLTDVVPFLNARLQGLDKIYRSGVKPSANALRAMFGGKDAGTTDKQLAMRFAAVTGALTLATLALRADNEDDEDYRKLEDWHKDTYWSFKIDGDWYHIPKPFEVGAIATLAERLQEQVISDNPEVDAKLFRKRVYEMAMGTFSFDPTPQIVKPALELWANTDSFTDRPIESTSMQRLSPERRYRSSTSELAKGLSNAGTFLGDANISPVQYDHLIKGYLGWLGATASGHISTIVNTVEGKESPAKAWYEYQPVRRFYTNLDKPTYTKYSTMFYEYLRESNRIYSDINAMRKEGIEFGEYRKENINKLRYRKMLNKFQRTISKINARMNIIKGSNKSADIKRQELDLLQTRKNLLQERAVKKYLGG